MRTNDVKKCVAVIFIYIKVNMCLCLSFLYVYLCVCVLIAWVLGYNLEESRVRFWPSSIAISAAGDYLRGNKGFVVQKTP